MKSKAGLLQNDRLSEGLASFGSSNTVVLYFGSPSTTYERQFDDLSLNGFKATYCGEESNASASSIVANFRIVIVFGGWPESVVPFAARTINSPMLGMARAPAA